MAGEPILIVDDTPVNLKLTRILLEHEGYEVRTANSAEEALEFLNTFRPRLILADIQMPGMDGLEMTRRIKQDTRNDGVLVVALTALASPGDEERALQAGCDGYITKPIDTRDLRDRIRAYLHADPVATDPVAGLDLDDLRAEFLDEARQQVALWLEDLEAQFDMAGAQAIVHQWIGSGGLLGFRQACLLARDAESILRQKPVDLSDLRESLEALLAELLEPTVAAEEPAPPPIAAEPKTCPLVLIADSDANRRALGKALFESQSIECRSVGDGSAALAAVREFEPRVLVLDVDLPEMSGYEVLGNLAAEKSRVKILLLTAGDYPQVAGADDYLVKPFNPLELVVRVQKLLLGASA